MSLGPPGNSYHHYLRNFLQWLHIDLTKPSASSGALGLGYMNTATVQTYSREGKPQTTREGRSGGHRIHTWHSSTETKLLTWHFVKSAGKLMMRKKRQVHPWLSCMKCVGGRGDGKAGAGKRMGQLLEIKYLGKNWDRFTNLFPQFWKVTFSENSLFVPVLPNKFAPKTDLNWHEAFWSFFVQQNVNIHRLCCRNYCVSQIPWEYYLRYSEWTVLPS